MKRAFFLTLVSGLILAVVCPLFPEKITFIHSNDTHGNFKPYMTKVEGAERLVGGMEATSHYINEIRAREKNVFLIETGDILTGTLAAEIEYEGVIGGVMMEFLNRLDYDVWSYGNHDFDRGQPNAFGLSNLARFPTVMANIIYKKSGKLFPAEPYYIFEAGGIKVGVIAVMEENFLTEVQKEMVEDLDVLPVVPTLNSYVPELDKMTDLIVVISHGWFNEGVKIARNVAGIDIVLVAAEDGKFKDVDGVLVKSTKGHQETLGYLRVEVDDDKVVRYEERLIWLWADIDLKPSPHVAALVSEVDKLVGEEYAKVIGEARADHTVRYYPGENTFVESMLGNWITDVMCWKTGAQIGFHNTGAIRADIKAGPVTKSNIFDVAPFHNTLVVFKLTGKQLKDALETDVERGWDRIQVSGMKYKYHPKKVRPYGERIDYIEIKGEVLVKKGNVLWPGKVYTIVSNNYLVGHAKEKYLGFPVTAPKDTGIPLDNILMEWLDKYKVLNYKIEERIVEIR